MITQFKDNYNFLSNFYNCDINFKLIINKKLETIHFKSSEVAYQYGKPYMVNNIDMMNKILQCNNMEIKKYTEKIKFNSIQQKNWDTIKLTWMYRCLELKFTQNENLKQYLMDTYPKMLIKGNYHNDKFWGICLKSNSGQNNLGLLLMLLRNRLIYNIDTNIFNYNLISEYM